tara:strand:+ start:10270 stop:11271 length:1002 start_codon:yes stop_codon:yes gene_type:complete
MPSTQKTERSTKPDADKLNSRVHADPVATPETNANTNFGKHATMPVLVSDLYSKIVLPDLQEFDPSLIKLDATIVAVGKRRTGKSWVFRNIMYHMRDKFQAGIVISQTDELNKFWRQYVPAKYIYNKYDPSILQAVFERQKKILNDQNRTDEEKEKEAPFFILLDDVVSDQRLKYDESLMELFVAGRHYKLFVLITTQYAKGITPILRGNTDYCFMMKTLQQGQIEALWEDFGSFLTKAAFAQILNTYTEDNETLVVNTCPDTEVTPLSMLSWWKAVDPGEFHMGSEEYWRQSMLAEHTIPQRAGGGGSSELMNVRDFMPNPWNNFPTERSGN